LLACCTGACDREAPRRAQLDNLIRQRATRQEVARQLGAGYELFEKNTENWKFLERECSELREKVERYHKAMFYTTAWTTTWVFLDEKDIARDYCQGSQ
jgi:hypothetical protein